MNKSKLTDIEKLFKYYDNAGLKNQIAVIHGLSPTKQLGRDIDVLTNNINEKNVINLTCLFLQETNFKVIKHSVPWGTIIIGLKNTDLGAPYSLEIDINVEFFWGLTSITRTNKLIDTYNVSNIPCAKWESFIKRILLQFLSGNLAKYNSEEKQSELAIYKDEKDIVEQKLNKIFGKSMADSFCQAIRAQNWSWFKANCFNYRIRFSAWSLINHPTGLFRNLLLRLKVQIYKHMSPQTVPDVCCTGDDVDKLKVFCDDIKDFLSSHYVFSSIESYNLEDETQLQSIKKDNKLKQRMLGLFIFYSEKDETYQNSRYSIHFDITTINYQEAAKKIIEKHYQLAKDKKS
jgi:hypothetical protein